MQRGPGLLTSDPDLVQPGEIVQNFIRNQQEKISAISQSAQQPTKASHGVKPHAASPYHSAQDIRLGAVSDKVRVMCTLGKTKFGIWLDLDSHPGEFVNNVEKQFKRREIRFDQSATVLWLKPEKGTPDEENYELSLNEDDLDADWATAIDWLRDAKKENSHVMYGVFHIDED